MYCYPDNIHNMFNLAHLPNFTYSPYLFLVQSWAVIHRQLNSTSKYMALILNASVTKPLNASCWFF